MRRTVIDVYMRHTVPYRHPHASHCTICAPATDYEPIQRSTSITVYKQLHFTTIHSSALSSLRKVIITESARNKLPSSHHTLNSLLFAPDGYPTATEDPAEIEETARTGTVGGGDARSGWEHRDWVPLCGGPTLPFGKTLLPHPTHKHLLTNCIHDHELYSSITQTTTQH